MQDLRGECEMNRKMMKLFLQCFLLLVFFSTQAVVAQKLTVNATVDSVQLWIGQQTHVRFEITQQPGEWVQTPVFSEELIKGIELVEPVKNDSSTSADGHLVVKQSYLVTSFTDSLYLIPAFPFVSQTGDTVWSPAFSLKVIQPFVIDTAANEITDIKEVLNPRFSLKYFLLKVLPWLGGTLLFAAIIALIAILLKKKPLQINAVAEKKIPAHELALAKLKQVKEEKLWQHDRQKEYHTQLTDILREYIESTFDLPAPELTSDEILSHLSFLRKENKQAFTTLHQILQLADLIKFAKWHATPDENELSLSNAVEFVNLTKTEEKTEDDIS